MDLKLIAFLLSQGGPILRWLTAAELAPDNPRIDRETLYADLLACPEVRRWLNLLGSGPVHHAKDSSAENLLAKLGEYGLRAGMPELDERALPYCAIGEGEPYHDDALILAPFLVRLGYASERQVSSWLDQRIDVLYEQACRADYDIYMSEIERQYLPPSQRLLHESPKLFYRLHFNNHWNVLGLPTYYDLFALAYLLNMIRLCCKKLRRSSIIYYTQLSRRRRGNTSGTRSCTVLTPPGVFSWLAYRSRMKLKSWCCSLK